MDDAIKRAGEDPLPPLEASEVSSFLSCAVPQTAPGADVSQLRTFSDFPRLEFWSLLPFLFSQVEAMWVWPKHVSATLNALSPKPKGGDHTTGIISNVIKLWSKLRPGFVASWSDSLGSFWERATRGSSSLRAALLRSLLDETAVLLGAQVATLLLEIENLMIM